MGNHKLLLRAAIRVGLCGVILLLLFLSVPHSVTQTQALSSAELESEILAKTAKRTEAQGDLAEIRAQIVAIDAIGKIPVPRLRREAEDQAKRAYLKYVEGLDPDLAGFAVVVPLEKIKPGLEKKVTEIEKRIATLDQEIAQLQAKVQQAEIEEHSQQFQQSPPGASSGGTKSQSGPPQPPSYTAPTPSQPPPAGAGTQPPPLPPGAYVVGFQVSCPGEAVAGRTVTCTAIGVYSHDPNLTVDLTESTEWKITGATEWKGSSFRTKDAAVVIVTATRGWNHVTRTVFVKARKGTETESGTKPKGGRKGGGGCGPGTSCRCAGGAEGHISCQTGGCHCGGN